MNQRTPHRPLGRGLASVAVLALATSGLGVALSPAADADTATQLIAAAAGAEVLHVNALSATVPGTPSVVDVAVAAATGSTDSARTARTIADARNIGGNGLLGQDLSGILATAHTEATVANPNPPLVFKNILPVVVPGVAALGVSTAGSKARWAGDNECLPSAGALSTSTVSTADAAVLPAAIPGVGVTSLLSLPGTAAATETTRLLPTTGSKASVQAIAAANIADLSLFDNNVSVQVVGAPVLTAVASGQPGGAKAIFSPAVLEVTGPNNQQVPIPLDGSPATIPFPANPALTLELSTPAAFNVVESADGRHAAAEAVTLHVKVALAGLTVADVDVAPLSVSATAPTGGYTCASVTPPSDKDTDGDGLSDATEATLGTNPSKADTDGDTYSDGAEVAAGTDPLDANSHPANTPNDDPDGDGLSNANEASLGTDPNKADTDGDGLGDGREVALGTDPNKADTDGDGLGDGREVNGTKTNPLKRDTDGDTLTDGQEVTGFILKTKVFTKKHPRGVAIGLVKTNPLKKDTDGDGIRDNVEIYGYTVKQRIYVKTANGKRWTTIGFVRSNPLKKDTDRDGLTDGQEKSGSKNGKFHHHKSNPISWDTDNGGVGDGVEVRHGSDPAVAVGKRG